MSDVKTIEYNIMPKLNNSLRLHDLLEQSNGREFESAKIIAVRFKELTVYRGRKITNVKVENQEAVHQVNTKNQYRFDHDLVSIVMNFSTGQLRMTHNSTELRSIKLEIDSIFNKPVDHGSTVRNNLMRERYYTPYCGFQGECGGNWPRTYWTNGQFRCPSCGWVSEYDPEFIEMYKNKWSIK